MATLINSNTCTHADEPPPSDIDLLNSCLRRIRAWRVPPNWSVQDWFGEMRTNSAAALWQAKSDYDPRRGVPLCAFERLRVIASAWTRYRQEWSYALHCPAERSPVEQERQTDAASGLAQVVDPVREALAQISEADRWLLEQLFWAENSEAAVARKLGVSQQAVSKRRGAVLRKLRRLLGDLEKESWKNRTSLVVKAAILHSTLWFSQDWFSQEVINQWL